MPQHLRYSFLNQEKQNDQIEYWKLDWLEELQ